MIWVQIKSWHLLSQATTTLCGRMATVDARTSDSLPMGEKSCESCLRIERRLKEKAG